jgi:hypothetical protein
MSFKRIVIAGLATTALAGAASANDTYTCGDQVCYDDQAEETRRLNEAQLENPGAGAAAVPPAGDRDEQDYGDADDEGYDEDGQGGPYEPQQPDDDTYGDEGDGADYAPQPGSEPSDDGAYDDEYGDEDDMSDDEDDEGDAAPQD